MMSSQRCVLSIFLFLGALLSLGLEPSPAIGQVILPPQPGNQVSVTVDADVTFDSASGLYTYTYRVTNAPTSPQEVWFFAIEFAGNILPEIVNATSPQGWTFGAHEDRPIVSWAATEVGSLPPDFVDDGNVVPSPFQIKPAQMLGGFSFQSPSPPDTNTFFAQGFTKLAQVTNDVGELPQGGQEILDFTQDSFSGTTAAPTDISTRPPFLGGRRPSVDGFLVFLNISNRETRTAPVAIVIKFSLNGEIVDQSTFRATLNGEDVTAAFVPGLGGTGGDLVAVFDLGASPLKLGRNVLLTSVQGIVPGSTRTASDVDRLTFFVQ